MTTDDLGSRPPTDEPNDEWIEAMVQVAQDAVGSALIDNEAEYRTAMAAALSEVLTSLADELIEAALAFASSEQPLPTGDDHE